MARYRPVDAKVDFPKLEERILEFWKRERIFQRSLELRAGAPEYVFYEGPPTMNNLPHVGHVEARTKRDIEAFGIAEFNRLCRESVKRYAAAWDRLTERIGLWIHPDEAYR